MKTKKKRLRRQHVWLGCMAVGPLTAYAAVFYPALSMIAVVLLIIGLKGTLMDIM
jgi:hypothetical protein